MVGGVLGMVSHSNFNIILHPIVVILIFLVLVAIMIFVLVCQNKRKFKQLQHMHFKWIEVTQRKICCPGEARSGAVRYCANKKKYWLSP